MADHAGRAVLRAVDLHKSFGAGGGPFSRGSVRLRAVGGISLSVPRGGTLGLVGESGCGKTTAGRCIAQLYEPDAGHVLLDHDPAIDGRLDELLAELEVTPAPDPARRQQLREAISELVAPWDVFRQGRAARRSFRRRVQLVFQDPWASLNPQRTVLQTLAEGPLLAGLVERGGAAGYVEQLMDRVGLPRTALNRYPHEFSGGQRQRIGIARALSVQPDVIICDEPVSALDVSVQAQILNLLQDLQEELGLSYLFISHDMGVVEYLSDRVAVMYLGRIVEEGPVDAVFGSPRHPYTRLLLDSIPRIDASEQGTRELPGGEPPSPINVPVGCPFAPRCPRAQPDCRMPGPLWQHESGSGAGSGGRRVWCRYPLSGTPGGAAES